MLILFCTEFKEISCQKRLPSLADAISMNNP